MSEDEVVLAKQSRGGKKSARRTVVNDPMEGSSKNTVTRSSKLKTNKKSLLEILNKSDSEEDTDYETNDDEGISDGKGGNRAVVETPDMFDSEK